jgi:TolA-binding protein
MACRSADKNDLATKYLNGQLNPAAQDDFELHILECRDCQHSLEALQAMRDALAARAHEIRSYSSVARGRLRWEWIGVAALFVVACGFGLAPFALHRLAGSKLAQQKSSTPNLTANKTEVSAPEKVAGLSSSAVPEKHSAPSIGPAPTSGLTAGGSRARPNQVSVTMEPTLVEPSKTEASQTVDNRKIENLPINERAYESLPTLNSQAGRDSAPSIGQAPNSTAGIASPDEWAVELARLGWVTPPTFTFSAVAASKRSSDDVPSFAFDASRVGGSSHGNTRSLFQAAMRAYAEKRYGDAKALLDDEVRLAPDVPEVNFFLGVCRLVKGKPSSAVQPLRSVLTHKESPYVQSAHFYLAKAYLQLGDLQQAEGELQAAAAMPGQLQAETKSTLTKLQSLLATGKEEKKTERSDKPN